MNPEHKDLSSVDLTGQILGDYAIIRRLGRGGMADVYLAEQKSLRRNVALKVLKPELAKDASYVKRFHHEAQAAAALVQSNIVQIYEVGNTGGIHFIAQEYVPGRNLREYLDRHGAVESLMALNVLRQVAMALQKAGELNVIHRDIKPENIMLSNKGEVKVADFGLARINDQRSRQDLTQIGITMGTPLYMSPEQVEGKSVDPRSDIYSLGVAAYHMLAGEPPFDGETAIAIAVQHMNKAPRSLSQLRPDIPEELADLVHQMMAKNPEDRPADAATLLRQIRKIKIDEDADWDGLAERLAAADVSGAGQSLTEPSSKFAVTRQLQSVMRGHVRSWWTSAPTVLLFGALILLGAAVGFGMASRNKMPNPFEGVESQVIADTILRHETVDQQYEYAFWHNTEKHWKSVEQYFPYEEAPEDQKNRTLMRIRQSKERLGELYLKREEWDKAFDIYEEFVNQSDLSERFTVIGWAGKAIIYDQQELDSEEKETMVIGALNQIGDRTSYLNWFMLSRVRGLRSKYGQIGISGFDSRQWTRPYLKVVPRSRS